MLESFSNTLVRVFIAILIKAGGMPLACIVCTSPWKSEYMSIRSSIVSDLAWGPTGAGVRESLGWGVILVDCLGKYLLNDVNAECAMISRGVDANMLRGELLMDRLDQELTPCVDCALACSSSNLAWNFLSSLGAFVNAL
eukprot:3825415-Ditylum_brightwellii.AAC.1